MALITKAVKGTKDALPKEIYKLQYVERIVMNEARKFGFKEIRTPVFEHTELFERSVGGTTDVVQKEMYTFDDKGARSITLRPEGTAGAARAFLENALSNEALPQKVCYLTSCYRYEKPQAGRLREFHQFGVECFGAQSPLADAEIIALGADIFEKLQIKDLKLEINSIGCPTCRSEYHRALKEYFNAKKDGLCETCLGRLETNPMRILDCKSPVCAEIAAGAPVVLDYLCGECSEHFEKVRQYLTAQGIDFEINPKIVRGLDYYTKTVFEFVSDSIGAQGTVCGGGRYDGLIEELGGRHTPSLGFALGIERLLLLMNNQGSYFPADEKTDMFLIAVGENAQLKCAQIAGEMRRAGFSCIYELNSRSPRAQMKYADKIGVRFTAVIGDEEIGQNHAVIKDMQGGRQYDAKLSDFAGCFGKITV
ncbi:MAG: histidine--tRNA ligase [Clostridiales bacterium]|nr:histidine--tRNA ligase [Clostridiales bacterium]